MNHIHLLQSYSADGVEGFFGAAAAGWLAAHIGRKRTIQSGALIGIIGCSLQAGAQNVGFLIGGRFVAGFSIGWWVLWSQMPASFADTPIV